MNDSKHLEAFGASAERLELLEYLLAEEGVEHSEFESVQPRAAVREIPLSFAQQRLWFLDQMESVRGAYNIPAAYEVRGGLNVDSLHRALNEIIRRHEVLRTVFQSRDGQPFQLVAAEQLLELPLSDLSRIPDHEQDSEVRRLAAESAEHPFDLTRGPLIRASLLRLGEERHILLLCMHHIVSDGWSLSVFFNELSVLFEAFSAGRSSPLPELPIQYGDFAIWQREWLQDAVLQKQLDYWKRQLSGLTPGPILLADQPRPLIQTYRGASHSLVIGDLLTRQLAALCRSENVTLFMLLLAAFKILLHRHSGRDHVTVGSPIANRNRTETEGLIGFFVNTLVLNTDLSGNPRFRELLARVRETAVGGYANQDMPFEMLVEELQPARSLSHSPLFQVMFTLQNASPASLRLGDLKVTPLRFHGSHPAKFDLTMSVTEDKQDIKIAIGYNADLFEADTIARLSEHFHRLLESIVSDPSQHISSPVLMSDAERRRILVEWNAAQTEHPAGPGLQQLFELQAERAPDAVAVVFGRNRYTYRDLNRKANELAHYLIKRGVEAEELIGVCLDRSAEMIVAWLGVLKAGAAYVPLDPSYPPERLSLMIEDSRIRQLVTDRRMLDRFPGHALTTVCLDLDREEISRESQSNPVSETAGDNAACVIYTSGSTGKPKGVVITHEAVARLVMNTDYLTLKPTHVIAQVSSASFDAITFEVWGALLNGARLAGVPTDVMLLPKTLEAEIREQRINVMFLTTALFNQLVREEPSAFRNIQHLLFGGEAADPAAVRAILKDGFQGRLLNMYGPTETTTFASWRHIEHMPDPRANVPIGRPIRDRQVYILDAQLQLVPVGVPGELYIGGEGLARGYLNRPDSTAERFVPDPFSSIPGSRLYRSGDQARYRSDGAIELLGRLDYQVKLRGFRIEPGEIEETLRLHPAVQQAVVLAREDKPGNKRLVAYMIPRQGPVPSAGDLRHWVQAKLPPYMAPSDFVLLKDFPLTPNGKVDRLALLRLETGGSMFEDAAAAPRDELYVQLTKIWQRVLKAPSVGIHDNFFELGGHSLLAVRLLAEVERATGKRLTLTALFQTPTIVEMARLLRQDAAPVLPAGTAPVQFPSDQPKPSELWSLLVPIQPYGSNPPFFWIHGDRSDALLSRYLGPDQPLYALVHQSVVDGRPARLTTVEQIASYCLSEMRTVQPKGPYFIGGYCFGGLVAWEIAQQIKRGGDEVALLALLDPSRPMAAPDAPPGAAPSSPTNSSEGARVRGEVSRHLESLGELNPRQKWMYVGRRVQDKLAELLKITQPVTRIAKTAICAAHLGLGYRIPYSLRSFYILRVYVRARKKYKLQVYPGQVSVFVSAGSADPAKWANLAAEGAKIFEISGDHTEILKEPFVQTWAEELRTSLQTATHTNV